MRKYFSFFRLRFAMSLQYRTAALAGLATQFFWGVMEIFIFQAFYEGEPDAFPMTMAATASYIWLQQAFLVLFDIRNMESDIFDAIMNGNVAYEMCRPVNLYDMWFSRNAAKRMAGAALRCVPILLFSVLLPKPLGLSAPANVHCFVLFLITLFLGLAVAAAYCMLIHFLAFFTISPQGLRMISASMVEFFAGAVIPIPFFPEKVQAVLELLPFASIQNVPLRIYSGSMSGVQMQKAVLL